MFGSILGAAAAAATGTATTTASDINPVSFIACVLAALALGVALTAAYMFRNRYTRSFVTTLAILPAVVCVVIMMVDGNIGAGVAVAGAFSLVRFRSAPGSARDIAFIFLGMCVGLVCGMGYLGYALLVTVVIGSAYLALQAFGFRRLGAPDERQLTVVVPEDLNYTGLIDDILDRYTASHELTGVRTTNMGSLFKLTYRMRMNDAAQERDLINEIRTRNGNLEVAIAEQPSNEASGL
ncbi:MAG: DUF4956 domain-containing protein [Coriobacteriales bacterium]|jgi:uncharacterized membrane protein YhiD involved in acid resistance